MQHRVRKHLVRKEVLRRRILWHTCGAACGAIRQETNLRAEIGLGIFSTSTRRNRWS
jgi:hypothetical protein